MNFFHFCRANLLTLKLKAMNFLTKINFSDVVFFKRWQNKGFAVFNSLRKVVIILTLPIAYLAMSFDYAFCQSDTIDLQSITVNSQRKTVYLNQDAKLINIVSQNEISASVQDNLTDILDGTIGLDIRSRGVADLQSDVSIRGGNFDQTLILLNGIPVSDVQTGHNSFDTYILPELIDKIEILQGSGVRVFGLGAYSGAINIVTKTPKNFQSSVTAEFGEYNFHNYSFSTLFDNNKKFSSIIGIKYSNSDGYCENTDFQRLNFYNSGIYNFSSATISYQLAGTSKNFGAYNFYTPKFPYQYEVLNKLFGSIMLNLPNSDINASFYNRFSDDEFQLFRETDDWYQLIDNFWIRNNDDTAKFVENSYENWAYYKGHNRHKTIVSGLMLNKKFRLKNLGNLLLGVNIEYSQIRSNVLGDIADTIILQNGDILTQKAYRTNYSAFADYQIKIQKIKFSAGYNIIYNSHFGFFQSFGTDVSFNINNFNTAYISVNQGIRLPTYTDLYYSGPSNQGNADLMPEKATTYETGYKFFKKKTFLQSALFFRNGKNTIDWVKFPDSTKWQTTNYTLLNTYGFETCILQKIDIKNIEFIKFDLTLLQQTKPETEAASKYSLNYLRYDASLSAKINLFYNISLFVRNRYSLRNGSYYMPDDTGNLLEIGYKPVFLTDIKLAYSKKFLNDNIQAQLYVSANNIFDVKYSDLSYVQLPGRWIKAGIKLTFVR